MWLSLPEDKLNCRMQGIDRYTKKGEYSTVNHVNKQEYSLNYQFDNYVE
jgi:hypothetical protein